MVLFVYGTLKRGLRLHALVRHCEFLGTARTAPGYTLVRVAWYPGMIRRDGAPGVIGELYRVDPATLADLDFIEGVPEIFTRAAVPLAGGPEGIETAEAYHFVLPPDSRVDELGEEWR
jgi:gamma-glutamylaminecyclotransferase